MTVQDIQNKLKELQDIGYKNFHSKLLPGVDPNLIIGIRTPVLRKFAKQLWTSKSPEVQQATADFLNTLPHKYYDENILHSFLLQQIKDYDECFERVEAFLPYMDNWAVCDSLTPKVFGRHKNELFPHVKAWLASPHTYTCRFGLCMLMCNYLEEGFSPQHLDLVAAIRSKEYYVRMGAAWYLATALAKQWAPTVALVESNALEKWTHNKTIQKAIESFRITPEQKTYLRTLRRK